MYSPTAIDIAPAIRPATPAVTTRRLDESAAATPITRLAIETIPSLAPSTAARNQPDPVAAVLLVKCSRVDHRRSTHASVRSGRGSMSPLPRRGLRPSRGR